MLHADEKCRYSSLTVLEGSRGSDLNDLDAEAMAGARPVLVEEVKRKIAHGECDE